MKTLNINHSILFFFNNFIFSVSDNSCLGPPPIRYIGKEPLFLVLCFFTILLLLNKIKTIYLKINLLFKNKFYIKKLNYIS